MEEGTGFPSRIILLKNVEKSEMEKSSLKHDLRIVIGKIPPGHAKIRGGKFEEKQDIHILFRYTSLICI